MAATRNEPEVDGDPDENIPAILGNLDIRTDPFDMEEYSQGGHLYWNVLGFF